jgi:regulator of sirC expression with transglutaminase-like and TPR domain
VTEPHHRRQLIDMVARPEHEVDLARASLLVACDEYPQLEVDPYLERLDAMAGDLRGRLEGPPEAVIAALNHVLFEEQGFRGNTEEYYDPRNSLLNDVLDRRTGIPITLSTIYMAVGRRAGVSVQGIGLPGHFVVRVSTPSAAALVDPFHGGTVVTMQDCQERLDRIYGRRVPLGPEMLEPCPPRALLSRMVRNLKAIYLKAEDHERALKAADLLVLLNPEAAEDRRDRGLILAALECYAMAADDLEAYLAAAPRAAGADQIRTKTAEMRHKAARLN